MENPLLALNGLPPFSKINPEHIEPAIDQILAENRQQLAALVSSRHGNDWESLVTPLEELNDRINRAWSPVNHLHAVMNSEELRKSYNACLPKLCLYQTEVGQNEGLYTAYNELRQCNDFAKLSPIQCKIIDDTLRDFRLSGVDLPKNEKARFREIMTRLSELQAKFEQNVLDATDAWHIHVTDIHELAGIPEMDLERAAERAREQNKTGWAFGLDFPSYSAVITHAENRQLRETIYTAYVTRASDTGPDAGRWDNTEVMSEIIELRREAAELLGFTDYAEYSLAKKMAATATEVKAFLKRLVDKCRLTARQEYAELRKFAAGSLGLDDLKAWDIAFCSERYRQAKFAIDQEQLRLYFPITKVLPGMFQLVKKLYGITVTEIPKADTWHPDVRFFAITDSQNALRGHIYIDLYARPNKRSGAWMDECINRFVRKSGIQTPVAYLICNFSPPQGDLPSLLKHDDVLTLFHEFGHCLQHILTQVNYPAAAGINSVEWDAVEIPSQFHENFAWQKEIIDLISGHVKTGESLPNDMLANLKASKNFHAGLKLIRQLEFGLFDIQLHSGKVDNIQDTLHEVRAEVTIIPVPEFNRFSHTFSHIFAGGYAAGYYGYLWSEVLSSDAFAAFEESGLFNKETGKRFLQTFLELGGSRKAEEVFKAFRGRDVSQQAFLRHHGIEAADHAV
ncbi:MAG: M3 family metallopeptidase [Gammaproteobacteria bacterium]|nr:M3 family metallopeptidase [Gammaproteobacteria bacterium]